MEKLSHDVAPVSPTATCFLLVLPFLTVPCLTYVFPYLPPLWDCALKESQRWHFCEIYYSSLLIFPDSSAGPGNAMPLSFWTHAWLQTGLMILTWSHWYIFLIKLTHSWDHLLNFLLGLMPHFLMSCRCPPLSMPLSPNATRLCRTLLSIVRVCAVKQFPPSLSVLSWEEKNSCSSKGSESYKRLEQLTMVK